MANYLYNGVELPDINEVWTAKETYPYAVVLKRTSYTELLIIGAKPEVIGVACYVNETTKMMKFKLSDDSSSWINLSSLPDGTLQATPGSSVIGPVDEGVLYTNFDLYTNSGWLYSRASNPIPVGTTFPCPEVYKPYVNTAKKIYEQYAGIGVETKVAVAENQNYISVHMLTDDFKLVTYDRETTIYTATGIAFVTYDKRTDKWSAEVVDNTTTPSEGSRYLNHWIWSEVDVTWNGATVFTNQEGWYYNAVKFPNIDEVWTDKETYPYVELAVFADPTDKSIAAYTVNCYSEPAYIKSHDDNAIVGQYFPKATNILSYSITWHEGLASELGFNVGEWSDGTASSEEADTYAGVYLCTSLWSNYDIIDVFTDSIYLAASDPVHVTYDDNEGNGKGLFDFSGAIAPELPAYDSTMYPCATILEYGTYNDQPRYYLCLHNGYNHVGASIVEFTEPMIAYSYVRGSEAWVSTEVDQSSFDTMELAWSNTSYTSTDGNVNINATTPTPLDSYTLVFGPTSISADTETFKHGNYTMYKVSEELLPSGVSHAIISTFGLTTSTIMPVTTIGNSQVIGNDEFAFVISVDEDDLSTFDAPSPGLYFANGILFLINCCAYKVKSDGGSTNPIYDMLSFQIGLALGLCGKGIPENLQVIGESKVITWDGTIGSRYAPNIDGDVFVKISNLTPDLVGATLEATLKSTGDKIISIIKSEHLAVSNSSFDIYDLSPAVFVIVKSTIPPAVGMEWFSETGLYMVYMTDEQYSFTITLP